MSYDDYLRRYVEDGSLYAGVPDEDGNVGKPWGAIIAAVVLIAIALVCVAAIAWTISAAQAHDADPKRDAWYESLKNGSNVMCCDRSDGHQLAWDHVKQIGSQWHVLLEPEKRWAPVPPQAVIRTPSIDGQPYLFRMPSPVDWSPDGIRCFVPPIPGY